VQLAAACQEAIAARAKVSADAKALEWLCGEQSQLAGTMDELRCELMSAGEEHDAVLHLSEEREE
jgi:hypothetical protein